MNQEYKEARQHAEHLMHRVQDLINNPSHPLGSELLHETHQLVEDFEMNKNPRSIEDRIKLIGHTLEHIRHEGDKVMDFNHVDTFRRDYEHLQMELRKFSNY
jgi:hypothetical protein